MSLISKISKVIYFVGSFFVILDSNLAYADKPTVKIGWLGPLTGDSAVLGVDSSKAIEMVFEKANATSKVNFKLIVEDDQYNTAKSLTAYRKLVDLDNVKTIVFLTYGGLFPISSRAQNDRVLLVDPLDCNNEIAKLPDSVICVAAMTEGIGELNAKLALKSNQTKGAILYFLDDPFMSTVAKSTEISLTQGGGKIVFNEGYISKQSDFRTLLLKVKSAGADSLYIYGYDEAANIMKQARQIGINVQFYTTATVMSPPFITAAGAALNGTRFSVFAPSADGKYDVFRTSFEKKYGQLPILDIATVPSFDIANLIVEFTNNYKGVAGSVEFSQDLNLFLSSIRDYKGASGTISLDKDGVTRSLVLQTYQVQGGKKEIVKEE